MRMEMMMMIGFLILVSPFIFSSCHFLLPMVLRIQGSSCSRQDSPLFSTIPFLPPQVLVERPSFFIDKMFRTNSLGLKKTILTKTNVWGKRFGPLFFEILHKLSKNSS